MDRIEKNDDWWTEQNALLFHAINYGCETKGNYQFLAHKPLPERGQINASILNPKLPVGYGSFGLILKKTTPVRMSYMDVGSYSDPQNIERRLAKGPMWTPQQMTQRQLMYFTLAAGSYNEVHVESADTAIEGIMGFDKSVDEFVENTIVQAKKDHVAGKPYISHVNAHVIAFPGTRLYAERKGITDLNVPRWAAMDLMQKGFEPKDFYQFRDAILSGEMEIDDVLKKAGTSYEEMMGGRFALQEITEEHRRRVIESLPMIFERR